VYAGDTNSANNSATVTLNVAGLNLVTQMLDFQMAKNAGAQFNVTIVRDDGCNRLGVGDWLDPAWDNNSVWEHGRSPGPEFIVECGLLGKQGEAYVDAFQSFQLRNGWMVKSFSEDDWFLGKVGFNIDLSPVLGSCNPLMKVHLRTYGLTLEGNLPPSNGSLRVGISITIEGPAGTDPFSGSPSVFCGQ
jgi:hypothetical protein